MIAPSQAYVAGSFLCFLVTRWDKSKGKTGSHLGSDLLRNVIWKYLAVAFQYLYSGLLDSKNVEKNTQLKHIYRYWHFAQTNYCQLSTLSFFKSISQVPLGCYTLKIKQITLKRQDYISSLVFL